MPAMKKNLRFGRKRAEDLPEVPVPPFPKDETQEQQPQQIPSTTETAVHEQPQQPLQQLPNPVTDIPQQPRAQPVQQPVQPQQQPQQIAPQQQTAEDEEKEILNLFWKEYVLILELNEAQQQNLVRAQDYALEIKKHMKIVAQLINGGQ